MEENEKHATIEAETSAEAEDNNTAGEEVATDVGSPPTAPTKKIKKLPIIVATVAIAVIVVVAVLIKVVSPSMRYSSAENNFASGNYTAAMEAYQALGDYKDSAEKAVLAEKAAHYQSAEALYSEASYEEAYEEYQLAGDYEDAADKAALSMRANHYQSAEKFFSAGDYVSAYAQYQLAGGYEDASQKIVDCADKLLDAGDYSSAAAAYKIAGEDEKLSYCAGMSFFADGDYTSAETYFTAANGAGNSAEMLNACKLMEAEEYYAKGYLNTAKDMYAALPEGFSYGDISAAARLETLNAHADFLEICGRWRCDAITSSVRQTHDSTGLWDEWEGDGSGYTVDITCVINDDDTVTMTAEAEYWRYTNYSLLSRNLKTTDNTMKFEYTGASRPSSVDEDYTNSFSGNHITSSLTIQPNNFVFSWLCVDENYSMDFTYRYKTNGTYDTFVEAH